MSEQPPAKPPVLAVERLALDAAAVARPVFVSKGWMYASEDLAHVPTEAELALTVQRLISNVVKDGSVGCASGRFVVERDKADGSIGVFLELAEWSPE